MKNLSEIHTHSQNSNPMHKLKPKLTPIRRCSSVVEHFLGKEGVMSSTLIIGSTSINKQKINCN